MDPDKQILDLHPRYEGERFTLHGIYRDVEPAFEKATEYMDQGYAVYAFKEPAPSGRDMIFVARRQQVERMPRAPMPHEHSADWEATRIAVSQFREMERRAKSRDEEFVWYKPLDVERLRRCFTSISWTGSHLDVVAEFVSRLITSHPFPNANHRTSLALGRLYLRSVSVPWPEYSLRGGGADRFFRDTKPYYRDSKYLLRIIRSSKPLEVAYQEGYTHILIGPDTEAEIHPPDLTKKRDELRAQHESRTAHLIRRLADSEATKKLSKENTRSLREWVAWVRGD